MILFVLKAFGFCFCWGKKIESETPECKTILSVEWRFALLYQNWGRDAQKWFFWPNLFISLGLSIFMLLLSSDVCVQLDLFFPQFGVVKFCGTFVIYLIETQLLYWSTCFNCFYYLVFTVFFVRFVFRCYLSIFSVFNRKRNKGSSFLSFEL